MTCWNSGGLRASATSTPGKMAFFDKQFPNGNFAIAAFIETHHKNEEDFPDLIKEYMTTHHLIHTPTSMGHTHKGIIVLIHKEYNIINTKEQIPGTLLNIHIENTITKSNYNISLFYGPRWAKMNKTEMIKVLDNFNVIHNIEDNNIILGDFNFADKDIDKGTKMNQRDKTIDEHWEKIKLQNGIVDPFRLQYPKKKIFSFVEAQGKSRGDRVYVSEDNAKNISNIKYIHTTFNLAHKIMTFDLREQLDIGRGYWKMNSSVLKDEAYKKEIEEAVQGMQSLSITNPIDWWDLFIIVVRGITMSYTKKRSKIKNGLKTIILSKLRDIETIEYCKMTIQQKEQYLYYKQRYQQIVEKEIQGYQIRTRGHPTYEINEPDINFYSKLEKRSAQRNIIIELEDENGQTKTEKDDLIKIAETYYTKLYTPSKIDLIKQGQMLKNVDKRISLTDKQKLDAPITEQELEMAVGQQHDNKSPGLDGITAEFYKNFWYLIKDNYLAYINAAYLTSFGEYRNTSVTTIIYKHKGETYILSNYRPISLINVDLKILTRTLTNRLRPILPTVIHQSQTAVEGRRIDYTIHMLRDLIDLVDKEESQAAFIFLDQEKAFDRVDHEFLYKTMDAFGIGQGFIKWVRLLYANAATKIIINGHLSSSIPLKRGVRQGCSLSALLYVLVIEILALQLRKNPNIVGFQVNGEKIISLHYADDAIITIKQNKCFKEVIKDLGDYELASGAKINYEKTKGLWTGKWTHRQDKPIDIEWTNKNVKTLGVYFGNENPAKQTFEEIIPKIKKSMDYWKQFKLSKFAKARVIEIFHASRLWYAAKFYSIPPLMVKQLSTAFFDYVNFPHTNATVNQLEMKKLREDGGIKLVDIDIKSETSKITWLMELVTNSHLHIHTTIMTELLGRHKGGLQGIELFFTTHYYAKKLILKSDFYTKAIQAITKLQIKKKIEDPM